MLMLITYDISFDEPNGQARLRRIAKHCLDYGVRAQYSVFECDVTPDQWVMLKNKLLETYDPTCDFARCGNPLHPAAAASARLCVETRQVQF